MNYEQARPIVYCVGFLFLTMLSTYHYIQENWTALAVMLALQIGLLAMYWYFGNKKKRGPEKTWRSYDP